MAYDNVETPVFAGIKTVVVSADGEADGELDLFLFVRESDGLVVGDLRTTDVDDLFSVTVCGPEKRIEGNFFGIDNALRALAEGFSGTNG